MTTGEAPGAAYLLDKSAGITSRRASTVVADAWGFTKYGHSGTLDPDATGLLIVLLGKATRLAGYLSSEEKSYSFKIILGIRTDTDDATGRIIHRRDADNVRKDTLLRTLESYTGWIRQRVPDYSAVKVNGVRAYSMARRGISVDMPSRRVHIKNWKLIDITGCIVHLSVTVSSGTYIRGLARDIGESLETGGTATEIRRTAIGSFSIDEASSDVDQRGSLLDMAGIMRDYSSVEIGEEDVESVSHGRRITGDLPDTVALIDKRGRLVAVAKGDGSHYQPVAVLMEQ